MTPEEIIEELGRTDPASVSMLTGAGVSVEGPASLPTGEELTRRVFDSYFEEGTLDRVHAHHRAVGWLTTSWCPHGDSGAGASGAARPPRLETVLGVAAGVHGHTAVADILADVSGAAPNRNHVFLAGHLGLGGRQLTANFDTCAEKAADRVAPGWRARGGRVLHFHGSLAADPSGAGLGATLARIQGGFTGSDAEEFLAVLPDRGVLLVLGYSGSDFFDVDVAVAGLPAGALDLLGDVAGDHLQLAAVRDAVATLEAEQEAELVHFEDVGEVLGILPAKQLLEVLEKELSGRGSAEHFFLERTATPVGEHRLR
jgi:hypothetical protein